MKDWGWTPAQFRALEAEVSRTHNAGLFRRLLALWHIAQGQPVEEVAQWLRVDRSSVYRWMERFALSGKPAALEDRRGQAHYSKWDEDCEGLVETAMLQSPRQFGYLANQWNASLLRALLSRNDSV